MSLLEKLSINKKITAFFADGSQRMNLGVGTVVDLLKNTERVAVQIAPVKRAERLLTDFAKSAGRTIQKVEDSTFLAQSASPEPEPAVVEAPVEVAQPEAEVVAQPVATVPGVTRKYPTLSKTFFNGGLRSWVNLCPYLPTYTEDLMADCAVCKGEGTVKCPNCKGTGNDPSYWTSTHADCPKCSGTGRKTCNECKGTGRK
jgi:hypothetical protein